MNLALTATTALGLTLSLVAQAPRHVYTLPNPTAGQWLLIQQHFDALDSCCGVMPTDGDATFVADAGQKGLVASLLPTAVHQRGRARIHTHVVGNQPARLERAAVHERRV